MPRISALPSRFRSILITGASSGIGRALAEMYARSGAHLLLMGTHAQRLGTSQETCLQLGAKTVDIARIDVTDQAAMRAAIEDFDKKHPLDLVVANAGVSGRTSSQKTIEDQTRKIFDVNVTGVFNTCFPALDHMKERGHGKIAIVASAAGLATFPYAIAYSASKAAARVWAEGMYEQMREHHIEFCSICPGFIETPMTEDTPFRTPKKFPLSKATKIIYAGLEEYKPRIVFPWIFKLGGWILNLLPLRAALFLAGIAHGRKKSNRV